MDGFLKCPECGQLDARRTQCAKCGYVARAISKSRDLIQNKKQPAALQVARASVVAPLLALFMSSLGLRFVEDQADADVASWLALVLTIIIVSMLALGIAFGAAGLNRGIKGRSFRLIAWSTIGLILSLAIAATWIRPLLGDA